MVSAVVVEGVDIPARSTRDGQVGCCQTVRTAVDLSTINRFTEAEGDAVKVTQALMTTA